MLAYHDFLCAYNYYYCNIHFVCANGVTVCTVHWLGSEPAWNGMDAIKLDIRSTSFTFAWCSPILARPPPATSHRPVIVCVCVAGFFGISTTFKPFNYSHNIIKMLLCKRRCTRSKICRNTLYRVEDRQIEYQRYGYRTHSAHVRMSAYKMNFRRDYNRIQLDVIAGKTSRKNVLLLLWFFFCTYVDSRKIVQQPNRLAYLQHATTM